MSQIKIESGKRENSDIEKISTGQIRKGCLYSRKYGNNVQCNKDNINVIKRGVHIHEYQAW